MAILNTTDDVPCINDDVLNIADDALCINDDVLNIADAVLCINDAVLNTTDAVLCINDDVLNIADDALCINDAVLNTTDDVLCIKGHALNTTDAALCIKGHALNTTDAALCIEKPVLDTKKWCREPKTWAKCPVYSNCQAQTAAGFDLRAYIYGSNTTRGFSRGCGRFPFLEKARRADIFVAWRFKNESSSVGATSPDYAAPLVAVCKDLEFGLGCGSTMMPRLRRYGRSRTTKLRSARQSGSLSGNAQTSRRRLAMTHGQGRGGNQAEHRRAAIRQNGRRNRGGAETAGRQRAEIMTRTVIFRLIYRKLFRGHKS